MSTSTFRETVALVAAKAKAKLPEAVNGRVEGAVKLVLAHDVTTLEDGTIEVGSCSEPLKTYHLVGDTCTCEDWMHGKAPGGWCRHRIAAGIDKRVRELLVAEQPSQSTRVETGALPEAPASVNVHLQVAGRDCQLTLRDHDEGRLLERLAQVLAQYPLPVPAASPAPPQEGRWCHVHQVTMHLNHGKDGRQWWSHRRPEGGFCKGK